MKFIPSRRNAAPKPDRRGLVVGAGVAGVAGAAAALLHRGGVSTAAPAERATAAPATNPGYQVTPHVQRYYETAKG